MMRKKLTVNKDLYFYDTSALLELDEDFFIRSITEKFLISSITLQELENIKVSRHKGVEIQAKARKITRLLQEIPSAYEVIIHRTTYESPLNREHIEITNDTRILADAFWCNLHYYKDRIVFVTNDLALRNIANLLFGNKMIQSQKLKEEQEYLGYCTVRPDDDTLALFYSNNSINHFKALPGQYIIILNEREEVIDMQVWTGKEHRRPTYGNLKSTLFGTISPVDIYQQCAYDSFHNNQVTMIKGPAGSGKTLLSLAYLMQELEKGRLDKIVIFCNTVATANSAKLGFYPGSRLDKLLDSQIGNLLMSKFGGRDIVEAMVKSEQLVLLPMSDIRGYDTSGMRAGVYISEAQNLDISLIKLALQRIGTDSICIIDGDIHSQVDLPQFAGENSGMRRVSKVFRGHDFYGEVTLEQVYRSPIAALAEKL